jgi:hypothetical protein
MGGSLRLLGIHMSVHARNEPFIPSYRDRRAMYGRPLALYYYYVADTSVILLHIALGSSERHGPGKWSMASIFGSGPVGDSVFFP